MSNKPFFTEQQLVYLEGIFPKPVVVPGASRDALMYAAGARAVIDVITKCTTVTRRVRVGD